MIEIAAREGGCGYIAMNAALKTAVDNAKADNVPNANIDRAVKKGTGELKGDQMEAVTYECYGPSGVACIIECLTDNKNRTLANVRSKIEKRGGKWAESGSVAFMFQRKGVVVGSFESALQGDARDELELTLIDAGAEDISWEGGVEVVTGLADWAKVRDVLKSAGCDVQSSGLKYRAHQSPDISDADMENVADFIAAIEEDDDVMEVHTNLG